MPTGLSPRPPIGTTSTRPRRGKDLQNVLSHARATSGDAPLTDPIGQAVWRS